MDSVFQVLDSVIFVSETRIRIPDFNNYWDGFHIDFLDRAVFRIPYSRCYKQKFPGFRNSDERRF